jgi:hypothetical protein
MRDAFRDDISERQKEYVDTPVAKQIARRTERMEKRLTNWFGELNPAQRQRVQAWSQALGDQNRQWIANRQHWQQQLMLAMNQTQRRQLRTTPGDLAATQGKPVDTGVPRGLSEYRAAGAQFDCGPGALEHTRTAAVPAGAAGKGEDGLQ